MNFIYADISGRYLVKASSLEEAKITVEEILGPVDFSCEGFGIQEIESIEKAEQEFGELDKDYFNINRGVRATGILKKQANELRSLGCPGIGSLSEKEVNNLRLCKDFTFTEIYADACPECEKITPCEHSGIIYFIKF